MKKHFVTFYSPGTFVAEETRKPIEKWNVRLAVQLARTIMERHGATPYGFRFSTRERKDDELDSKETMTSKFYYLGGEVKTLQQLEDEGDPDNRILISNTNSWKWTQPLKDGDVVLSFSKNGTIRVIRFRKD